MRPGDVAWLSDGPPHLGPPLRVTLAGLVTLLSGPGVQRAPTACARSGGRLVPGSGQAAGVARLWAAAQCGLAGSGCRACGCVAWQQEGVEGWGRAPPPLFARRPSQVSMPCCRREKASGRSWGCETVRGCLRRRDQAFFSRRRHQGPHPFSSVLLCVRHRGSRACGAALSIQRGLQVVLKSRLGCPGGWVWAAG